MFTNKFKNVKEVSQGHEQSCCVNNYDNISADVNIPCLNIDNAISSLNEGLGHDLVHVNHLKYAGPLFY